MGINIYHKQVEKLKPFLYQIYVLHIKSLMFKPVILCPADSEIKTLKAVVHGVIAGIPIPFPLPNAEACGKNLECPVTAGTSVTYFEGLPVKPIYPTVIFSTTISYT